MNRSSLSRSLRRAGARLVDASGVTRIKKYVIRRKVLDVRLLVAECRSCGARWEVFVPRGKRPPKGWRKCANGCNAHLVAKG